MIRAVTTPVVVMLCTLTTPTGAQQASEYEVVQHAKDLDATMEDYTEESVAVGNLAPGPSVGLTAVRELFRQAMEMFTPEMIANLKTARLDIVGEVAYVVWSALPAIPFASDTFVVRDGKILIHTAAVQSAQGS